MLVSRVQSSGPPHESQSADRLKVTDPLMIGPGDALYRSVDYYTGVRRDVASMIPEGVRSVLEVGCAAGGTGAFLRERGVTRLIGVELNPTLAESAREHYTQLLIGDVEEIDLSHIPRESLDCILYPDVLEHLRDPWQTLRRHLKFLRPGGFLVASIPNIRYYKAVRDLVLKGRWDYREAGILDVGHLRFFTLSSINKLFTENGLDVVELRSNARGSTLLKLLNRVALNRLQPFLVKQYLVCGRKVG